MFACPLIAFVHGEERPFVKPALKSRVKHEVSAALSANAMRGEAAKRCGALGAKSRASESAHAKRARFNAQVTEWLMVADCKSAALRSYGGSNPPLCTRLFFEMM